MMESVLVRVMTMDCCFVKDFEHLLLLDRIVDQYVRLKKSLVDRYDNQWKKDFHRYEWSGEKDWMVNGWDIRDENSIVRW